jgi:hypothetical protein
MATRIGGRRPEPGGGDGGGQRGDPVRVESRGGLVDAALVIRLRNALVHFKPEDVAVESVEVV